MKRIIYSPTDKKGNYEIQVDMAILYLDTSAWIDIVEAFTEKRVKLLTTVTRQFGNPKMGVFLSIVNFLELIRRDGDVSRFFSNKAKNAFNYINLLSIREPGYIVETEISNYLDANMRDIPLLDTRTHTALKLFNNAFFKRKVNDEPWFIKHRKAFDEMVKRDKTLDLSADIIEVSKKNPYSSFKELHTDFLNIVQNPMSEITKKKDILSREKNKRGSIKTNPQNIPSEKELIVKYAPYRIHRTLVRKYGMEKFNNFLSNPTNLFPEREAILADYQRMYSLNVEQIKNAFPGLYWELKITYWNKYKAKSRTGDLGDRNHAIYIPYVNYFATSDGVLIEALETEYSCVFSYGKIKIFKTQ